MVFQSELTGIPQLSIIAISCSRRNWYLEIWARAPGPLRQIVSLLIQSSYLPYHLSYNYGLVTPTSQHRHSSLSSVAPLSGLSTFYTTCTIKLKSWRSLLYLLVTISIFTAYMLYYLEVCKLCARLATLAYHLSYSLIWYTIIWYILSFLDQVFNSS
jgi:hypothetical protein